MNIKNASRRANVIARHSTTAGIEKLKDCALEVVRTEEQGSGLGPYQCRYEGPITPLQNVTSQVIREAARFLPADLIVDLEAGKRQQLSPCD